MRAMERPSYIAFAALGGALTVLAAAVANAEAFSRNFDLVWPPSSKSAPALSGVCSVLAVIVWQTLFLPSQMEDADRVKEHKRRRLLAQMRQALKWDEKQQSDPDEGDADCSKKDDEEESTRRPPSVRELYEMVFDDVEERPVSECGVDMGSEPYVSVWKLFKERVPIELEEAVKFTDMARAALESKNEGLSKEELQRVGKYRDGTQLSELLELYRKKICKHLGKGLAPESIVRQANECEKRLLKEQRNGLHLLVPLLIPLLPIYGIGICLMIFDSLLGAALWHSMATVLDGIADGTTTMEELKWTSLKNWVTFLFCIFSHLGSRSFAAKCTSQFLLKVRSAVMRCLVSQDTAFFDIYPSAVLQERLNRDAEDLASKIFDTPLNLLHMICMLVSNSYHMVRMVPTLFFVVLCPMPVVSLAQYFIIKKMHRVGQRQRKIGEHSAANTLEVIKEIRTVREFAMEREEADKFAADSSYRADIETQGAALNNLVFVSPLVAIFVGVRVIVTYISGFYITGNLLTVGQATQVGFAADHMQHIIRDLLFQLPDIVKVTQPLGRICDMLTSRPRIEPMPGDAPKLRPSRFEGNIEFREVDFTFPSEPSKQILSKLSFSISPGEKVAFVGATGCGKSTSIKLLERFYEPDSGVILLDGKNIKDYDVHHLRQHMSVVAQDNVLFSTTLRENITYGLPLARRQAITDKEIEAACVKANAWKFIQGFPRELETFAGERGVKLSGGQKQRLAIARAIIRNPTILLLDEATSALDSKAEGVVQAAIDEMVEANRTGCTIMIAHRLTTVKRCDRIMVLDHGTIKEQGPHDELLKIPIVKSGDSMVTGWYRDLWETQMGQSEENKDNEALKQRIKQMEQEILRLRKGALKLDIAPSVRPPKLGHARRADAPQKLSLRKVLTDCAADERAPLPLMLDRAVTTYE